MTRAGLVLLLTLALALGAAVAGPSDGMVVGVTKIVDNGSDADRFDLVILSEGYTEDQLASFAEHAQQFADFFLATPPFATNCSAFNIWRVDVVSNGSGADDPVTCSGGTGAAVDTYFDATFCGDGTIRRLLTSNGATAIDVLDAEVPGWDQALVIVNSETYGGSGGSVATTSLSGSWELIAVHEVGHAAFGLADEYEYYAGCGVDTDRDMHPAVEPVEPNVTTETDRTLVKWSSLIAAETAVPTTANADCSMCDPQADPNAGETVVGLYEGAHYYHCDSYRPAFDCMMRNFAPFCPVCTARILATLAPFQPANGAPTCDAGGPYTAECGGAQTEVALDGSGSSDPDCDELDYSWSGGFVEGTAEGVMPTVHFEGLGGFDVDLSVSDGDATADCSTEVTVEDTTPPDLMAPDDVVAECTSPEGTPVELGEPTVTDVCDAEVEVANDAPDLFDLGDTTVTWTATDDSGNMATDDQLVTVQDTTPPTIIAPPDVTAECTSPMGTPVELGLPTVSDICDADVDYMNDAPLLFPLGETIVTWTAVDDSGNMATAQQVVTIVDTTPPELSVSLSPDLLWPPNHKLVRVEATIEVSDICDAEPEVRLESIVSDEPDNGLGDGNTTEDIRGAALGTDDREFKLRSERAGVGDGRVYTVTYVAEDDSGNTTTVSVDVRAPHDKGKGND